MQALRIVVVLAGAWTVAALAYQVWQTRARRRDFARPAGAPARGLLYNFTTAMLPAHKESARLHALEFGTGVVLHVGVFAALTQLGGVLAMSTAAWLEWLRVPTAVGLVAGVGLLVRRWRTPLMRAISVPDDYVAAVATCGLLALATFPAAGGGVPLLAYAIGLLAYFPLGKLRHAVFFFVARADYGRRLGYRGVYPPALHGGGERGRVEARGAAGAPAAGTE